MPGRPRLLVLGATWNQVPLVEKARRMGFEVWAAAAGDLSVLEGVADRLLAIDTSDREALLEVVETNDVRGLVTCGTSTPILTIAWITERLGLSRRANPHEVALDATLKDRTRSVLAPHGLVPPGSAVASAGDAWEVARELAGPVVVKPADGGGGRGVTIVREPDRPAIDRAFEGALSVSRGRSAIVEAFVEGITLGVESITLDGEVHVLAVPQKHVVGARGGVTAGVFFPAPDLAPHLESIHRANRETIEALGIRWGPTHIDMVLDEGKRPFVIDVGPRLAGGPLAAALIPEATGYDLYEATIRLAIGDDAPRPVPRASDGRVYGSHFVVRDQPGVIEGIEFDEALVTELGFRHFRLLKRPGDRIAGIESDRDRLAVFSFGVEDHETLRENTRRFEESFHVTTR